MSLKPPVNPNYAAVVVEIRNIQPLPNCDNIVATPLLGYQALVGKDTQVGDTGILFTAETQLSDEYCRENNLYRHSELNKDPSKTGYLEDNRRVKAIKFRGHRSDALFMPIDSVAYTGVGGLEATDGVTFDELNGHEICRKYVKPAQGGATSGVKVLSTRVDDKFFPKHFDTENYFKNRWKLDGNDFVTVTQKLHGTSIRVGHTKVARKLTWKDRLAKKFGVPVQEFEYQYVFGSRNVTKDALDPANSHFYDTDIYSIEGKSLVGLLPKGFMVYGELVGWASPGKPIQAGYTYGYAQRERELYVYRVSQLDPDGREVDLSWTALTEFCAQRSIKVVPLLFQGFYVNLQERIERQLDTRLQENFYNALPVDDNRVDEGVVVRREGLRPLVLKAKSPIFLQYESKQLDKADSVDMESDDGNFN